MGKSQRKYRALLPRLGSVRREAGRTMGRWWECPYIKWLVSEWQSRWDAESRGRETYRFFPDVAARLRATWVEPDYQVSQILTGHGCFRKRLSDMRLCERAECYCGEEDEDMDHVLWRCPLYEEERKWMLDGITRKEEGPVYYGDLVSGRDNFGRLRIFAHRWHRRRHAMEVEERRRMEGSTADADGGGVD